MNWEMIGALGEIIGAIAVFVTLVYLALQIRQNTAAARSTATQAVSEQISDIYKILATDGELAIISARGLAAPEQLSNEEMVRFMTFMQLTAVIMQNLLIQTELGSIDKTLWESGSELLKDAGRSRGFRFFWEQRGYAYSSIYQEYVEKELLSNLPDPEYRPPGFDKGCF